MRILADLRTHTEKAPLVTQVEKVPPPGVGTSINGKYVLPMLADFPVTIDSYILGAGGALDGLDLPSQSFAHLLAAYPMFGAIYFNPLLTDDHVSDLDMTGQFKDINQPPPFGPSPPLAPVMLPVRFQTGREPLSPTQPLDPGQMPTHTALMPINDTLDGLPPRPGCIVTDDIDISDFTLDANGNPVGADEFLAYWKLYDFTVSDDIAADYGAAAGVNEPAIRQIYETDQEPPELSVYISPDNGDHWCPVGLLEPVAFCDKTTSIRLAFLNTGATKIYIAAYAVLF